MSLLIIRCPLKPFAAPVTASPSDGQDASCAEQFEWCLLEDEGAQSITGMGSTESMPYADEALVLLPTIDVRLIEAKVPLANAKKLQQILPNLIEDFVLAGVESIAAQALPPIPGNPVLQRTLALMDRAWFAWLNQQLEHLLAPRVRLIPECLLLSLPTEGARPEVAYQRVEQNIIFTQRTGMQLGVSWIEHQAPGSKESELNLPQALTGATLKVISWDWLAAAAQAYLQANSNSRSANFALNLLPASFRRDSKSFGVGGNSGLSALTRLFSSKALKPSDNTSGLTWTDPLVWRQPTHWLRYCAISLVLGFGVYLSWTVLDDWRWSKRLELLAVQNLSPAAIAALNQGKSSDSAPAVLNAFVKQVTLEQRHHGIVVDADFGAMATKLQQFKVAFGAEALQKLDYDGYAITFEFKPGALTVPPSEVLQRARLLGMAVQFLAPNRYRLEPYAGLGSN
ncbi:type II secretion system protein GspL [Polynucleobacter sp. Tro8-14-1]|uniref:type II secretion system protein GspL n=1 Tax=Polynucleobacter sp. Tro8-14-1 TaxID=1758383 RepID=UPI001C0CB92F|nr:hypothetical protein [Polynucleobacter sp. Tro8-14-1]